MLTKRVVLDQVTVTVSGHLQVKLGREIVEDGVVRESEPHRTTIQVGEDCAQFP